MLNKEGIEFEYRDYTESPLDAEEIRETLDKLGLRPLSVLRKRDPSYKKLGLTGFESDQTLIRYLTEYPTLLERPIGVIEDRAVVGRPPEKLLELVRN